MSLVYGNCAALVNECNTSNINTSILLFFRVEIWVESHEKCLLACQPWKSASSKALQRGYPVRSHPVDGILSSPQRYLGFRGRRPPKLISLVRKWLYLTYGGANGYPDQSLHSQLQLSMAPRQQVVASPNSDNKCCRDL